MILSRYNCFVFCSCHDRLRFSHYDTGYDPGHAGHLSKSAVPSTFPYLIFSASTPVVRARHAVDIFVNILQVFVIN